MELTIQWAALAKNARIFRVQIARDLQCCWIAVGFKVAGHGSSIRMAGQGFIFPEREVLTENIESVPILLKLFVGDG